MALLQEHSAPWARYSGRLRLSGPCLVTTAYVLLRHSGTCTLLCHSGTCLTLCHSGTTQFSVRATHAMPERPMFAPLALLVQARSPFLPWCKEPRALREPMQKK